MYEIKKKPEDFQVEEIPLYEPEENGEYLYLWMKKTNLNTFEAVEIISRQLGIPTKLIKFAGNKDKKAITKQLISIPKQFEKRLNEFSHHKIELTKYGYEKEPVSLGSLKGNKFKIRIYGNIPKQFNNEYLNLFGPQRFSINNHIIGKYILQRNWPKACKILLENKGIYEKKVKNHLQIYPNDFVGALKRMPLKILKLFVHAYQSYIWNETALEYHKKKIKKETLPLIGFDTYDKISEKYLKKDNLKQRDFIIKEIPDLTTEGIERKMYSTAKYVSVKDGVISFQLEKGSYATTFIDQVMQGL